MPGKIHRCVEDAHDLERGFVHAEEDHVLTLHGELAAGEEVGAGAMGCWVGEDGLELLPHAVEVGGLLRRAPSLKRIGPDGA